MRVAQIFKCERCGDEYKVLDVEKATPLRTSLCPTCLKKATVQMNNQDVQGNNHILDANNRCIRCGRQFREV